MVDEGSHPSTDTMDPAQIRKLLRNAKNMTLPQRFAVEQRIAKALGISFTADQLFAMSSPSTAVTRLESDTATTEPRAQNFGGLDLSARNASIDAVISVSSSTADAERAIAQSLIVELAQHESEPLSADELAELLVTLEVHASRPAFQRRHPEIALEAFSEISRVLFAAQPAAHGDAPSAGGTKMNSDR